MAEASYNLGIVLTKRKRFDDAIRSFKAALAIREEAPFFVGLGGAYFENNLLDDAKKEYRKALELNPQEADALVGLALVASRQKDPTEARARFDEAIAIRPPR